MTDKITWTNERRKLSQLIPWPRNPRQIRKEQAERLQDSLEEFGQVEPVCIGPGNDLYNGHQRLKSWAAKFGDIEIDVRVSSRPLTEKEREKLTVFLHKGAAGEWDFDTLANEFEFGELLEWGFKGYELGVPGADDPEAEWQGMPEFKHEDQEEEAAFTIRVFLRDADDLAAFSKLIGKDLTGRKFVWFSKQPHGDTYEVHDRGNSEP